MKTIAQFIDLNGISNHMERLRHELDWLLEARDAEHRAELLKLQDDLLQGANREVMAAALIERLRGELGEAERRLAALEAKGESGTHCCVAERCTEWRLP